MVLPMMPAVPVLQMMPVRSMQEQRAWKTGQQSWRDCLVQLMKMLAETTLRQMMPEQTKLHRSSWERQKQMVAKKPPQSSPGSFVFTPTLFSSVKKMKI